MQNNLSCFKFILPFEENKYEEIRKESFLTDIRDHLLYESLNPNIKSNKYNWFDTDIIYFKYWKIEIFLNKKESYFIPSFQLELYTSKNFYWLNKLIDKIFTVAESLWAWDYIFSYDDKDDITKNKNILLLNDLYINFKNVDDNRLKEFIKSKNINYIEDQLNNNKDIRQYLIFLIYLSYSFYINYKKSNDIYSEIENIDWIENEFDIYNWNLDLFKKRLDYVSNISIIQFKKYFEFLDSFFSLFKRH